MVPTTCNHAFSLFLPSNNISSPRSRRSAQQSSTSITNMPAHQQPTRATTPTGRYFHAEHCQHTTTTASRAHTSTSHINTANTVATTFTSPHHLTGQQHTTSDGATPTRRHHCPTSPSPSRGTHSNTSEGVCSPCSTSEGDISAKRPANIHQSHMEPNRHGQSATSAHVRPRHNHCGPTAEKSSSQKLQTKNNDHEIGTKQNSPPECYDTAHTQHTHMIHEESKQNNTHKTFIARHRNPGVPRIDSATHHHSDFHPTRRTHHSTNSAAGHHHHHHQKRHHRHHPNGMRKRSSGQTDGDMMELPRLILGPDGVEWLWSTSNEFGRLTKGVKPHTPMGSQTMRYIYHHELPKGRKATYSRFVVSERPHKVE
jgi:hypothetical protein